MFNYYSYKEINGLDERILSIKNSITDIRKDQKVKVFELLEANKVSIDKLDKRSQVLSYINEIKRISTQYTIEFA
jgi:hypothetical protein